MTNKNNNATATSATATSTTATISIFTATISIAGFNFKPGYVALVSDTGEILAATSGWECNNQLQVYRPNLDGTWSGNWEGPETFPVQETLSAIQEWQEEKEIIMTNTNATATTTAAALYDGGWRKQNLEQLIKEYALHPEQTDAIIRELERLESLNK